ncbi:hypothetical protein MesoLj131a_49210 [Mesorhizobium sp. 131-2-1]|nr:hypothetical protein MesoLj131a_49210 [Mesorhizobium sp. 131-2-1]
MAADRDQAGADMDRRGAAGLNKSPRYRLTAAAKAFSYARFAKHLDGPKQ